MAWLFLSCVRAGECTQWCVLHLFHFCIAICYFCPGTSGTSCTSCTSCNYIIYIIGSRSANPMNIKIHQDPPRSIRHVKQLQGNCKETTCQSLPSSSSAIRNLDPRLSFFQLTLLQCLPTQAEHVTCVWKGSIWKRHAASFSILRDAVINMRYVAGLVQQARDCSVVLSPASTSWLFSTHDDVCNFSIFFPVHLCPLCF